MKAQQRYQKLQQDAVTKFRSRFHAQSDFTKDRNYIRNNGKTFADPFRGEEKHELFSQVVAQSKRLTTMLEEHTKMPSNTNLEASARTLLQNFPHYSYDDDTKFITSSRILRTAVHFKIPPTEGSAVDRAIQIYARHTYMFDARVAASFLSYIGGLNPPNAQSILKTTAPRIIELAADFYVSECAAMLTTFAKFRVTDEEQLAKVLSENVVNYADCAQMNELSRAAFAIVRIGGAHTKSVMEKLTPVFSSKVDEMNVKDLTTVCRAYGRNNYIDRRFSNKLAIHALRKFTELSALDVAEIMHAFHLMNRKNEPFLRRCAMKQLRTLDSQTAQSISYTLSTLAHFKLPEHDVFRILGEQLETVMDKEGISALHCATVLHAYARARYTTAKPLHRRLVIELARHMAEPQSDVTLFTLCNGFWGMACLRVFQHPETHDAIVALISGLCQRSTEIGKNPVWTEMVTDAVRKMKEEVEGLPQQVDIGKLLAPLDNALAERTS